MSIKIKELVKADPTIGKKAWDKLIATSTGKSLVQWIRGKRLSITVRFVVGTDMPENHQGKAIGYCHPTGTEDESIEESMGVDLNDDYTVWVQATTGLVDPRKLSPLAEITQTLYHELLHAQWMEVHHDYSDKLSQCEESRWQTTCQTGHSGGGEEVIFHPKFAKKLNQFRRDYESLTVDSK